MKRKRIGSGRRVAPPQARARLTGTFIVPRQVIPRAPVIAGEMKYFDCAMQTTALVAATTTWVAGSMKDPSTTINLGSAAVATPLCLFAPTVGSALNQRVGRQVKMMKVKVRGTIEVPLQTVQTIVDSATQIRVLLVLDKQTNAAQMTGAALMNDGADPDSTLDSFQNPNNFGRFQVLKDRSYVFEQKCAVNNAAATTVSIGGLMKTFNFTHRFKNPLTVHFNATNGGTVADIVDNSLHVLMLCDQVTAPAEAAYYSRVSFKE